jgi:hypothetical protein
MPDPGQSLGLGRDAVLSAFKDIHRGGKVIVCGCGVSLTTLSGPDRFLTIGVNDVGRAFQPDYLVVIDSVDNLGPERYSYVENSAARAIFTPRPGMPRGRRNIVRFRLETEGDTSLSSGRDDIEILPFSSANVMTPFVALCLALHMGASTVGLIGVDLTDHHFFAATGPHEWAAHANGIDLRLAALGDAFLARGARVFNLSEPSRLRAFPKMRLSDFAALPDARDTAPSRRIVCYSVTPRVGVPAILARCINSQTPDRARAMWPADTYQTGLSFEGDINWHDTPAVAERELEAADAIVLHGGRFDARHETLLDSKPVVTLAHGDAGGMDMRWIRRGLPGIVLGQHQATLPDFAGWGVVPSPMPWHEPSFAPERKNADITIVYTPPAPHDTYPANHPLHWHGKGHAETVAVLDRLARRTPIRLAVVAGRGVSHGSAMAMKRRAHIVIDECATGSFHRSSLEGLAAGCVVVNGVEPPGSIMGLLRGCANASGPAPFIHATLDSLETILDALIQLGPDLLTAIGADGRAWLVRHWGFAGQWQRFWRPAIEQAITAGSPREAGAVSSRAGSRIPSRNGAA